MTEVIKNSYHLSAIIMTQGWGCVLIMIKKSYLEIL